MQEGRNLALRRHQQIDRRAPGHCLGSPGGRLSGCPHCCARGMESRVGRFLHMSSCVAGCPTLLVTALECVALWSGLLCSPHLAIASAAAAPSQPFKAKQIPEGFPRPAKVAKLWRYMCAYTCRYKCMCVYAQACSQVLLSMREWAHMCIFVCVFCA